ncbi:MAG: hypothetical protein PUD59_00440 [bacterium]|nr:hypothetical protein [bacterium]
MEFNFDYLSDIENTKLNKIKNNIYLSNNQIDILKRNNINYLKYNNLSELIFDIETMLNDGLTDEELEYLSQTLQELNYYNYTNK